jgi:AbrB family looped-hinge helix DNA binding protein
MARKYVSCVSSKGRITVPREILRRLGVREGDCLEFVAEDRRTLVRRVPLKENPFAKYAGVLGAFPKGKTEINAWLRDLRQE